MAVCSELEDKSPFNSPTEAKSPIGQARDLNAPYGQKQDRVVGLIKLRREAKQDDKKLSFSLRRAPTPISTHRLPVLGLRKGGLWLDRRDI